MKKIMLLSAVVLLFSVCSKSPEEVLQEQLPENVDKQYLISTEQATEHIIMMMGSLGGEVLTKSTP